MCYINEPKAHKTRRKRQIKFCIVRLNAKDPTGLDAQGKCVPHRLLLQKRLDQTIVIYFFASHLFIYFSIYQISNNCDKSFEFDIEILEREIVDDG